MELHQRLQLCQMRWNGLNQTMHAQELVIQNVKKRLDGLQRERFGQSRWNEDVCSGHGDCGRGSVSMCGWMDWDECVDPVCFGKNSTNADLCSGHGACVHVDQCQCVDGWTGMSVWILCELASVDHSAVVYQDGMWIFGGVLGGSYFCDVWQFRFIDQSWKKMQSFSLTKPSARNRHSAVVYQDRMWVFGGWQGTDSTHWNDVWMFNFTDSSWKEIETPGSSKPGSRRGHSAVVYQDAMWIFGGEYGSSTRFEDLWQFNFTDSSFWHQNPETDNPQSRSMILQLFTTDPCGYLVDKMAALSIKMFIASSFLILGLCQTFKLHSQMNELIILPWFITIPCGCLQDES